MAVLEIKDLHVSRDGKEILKGVNLKTGPGEVHAIMGPNGSGKSTLTQTIAGKENYIVNSGDIIYKDKSIIDLDPEERAGKGIFVSFQYPISLPGVNNIYFLKEAVNSIRKYQGKNEVSSVDFMKKIKEKIKDVDFDESFINRPVNEGFSGGEKKRNEILQLLMMEPSVAILDETDSGIGSDESDSAGRIPMTGCRYAGPEKSGTLSRSGCLSKGNEANPQPKPSKCDMVQPCKAPKRRHPVTPRLLIERCGG